MSNNNSTEKIIRYSLGVLLLVVAINAFGGGYYGMSGAKDVPTEWLKGSPFGNYFVPSLILFVCVGGSAVTNHQKCTTNLHQKCTTGNS